MKFCGACGALMQPGQGKRDGISRSLAQSPQMVTTTEPGGELRFVTVIFADLVGYTAFAEERAADDVSRVVGDLLQRLGAEVERQGGAVYQYLGDAVVAVFGLPTANPDAARNAVRAALAMQVAATQYLDELRLNLKLRVGVHAGEVMFSVIGGIWSIMGDTVNTANRIQGAAVPGQVWISRSVYEEVRRYFNVAVRPSVELKGKKLAVQPYEVLGERVTPLVKMPPFVGREEEWARIEATLQQALQNKGMRVLIVRGEAGVGKSRLVWEVRDWVQRQEQVYRVDLLQYDQSERLPSHGLSTLLRNRFNLSLDMGDDALVEKLRQRVRLEIPGLDENQAELAVEFFAFILGVSQPEFRIRSMDGQGKWEGAFVEVKAWLEVNSRQAPWILILEDAQKGDADTAAFFNWALRLQWNGSVVAIVTLREEDFDQHSHWYGHVNEWVQEGRVEVIQLHELPPALLAGALGQMLDEPVDPGLALRIAEHTEGNPLFATELLLLLKDQGALGQGVGLDRISLPASIRQVMEARIERLGLTGKEVAKRGALVGRRFTHEAVQRIWEHPLDQLTNGLGVLRETETIYEEVSKLFVGEVEQVFRHGRLQEAVLARVPREDRLRWLRALDVWAIGKLDALGENWEGAGVFLLPLIARANEEQDNTWQASLWYETLGLLHRKYHRLKEAAQSFRDALQHATGVRWVVLLIHIAEAEMFGGEVEQALQTLDTAGEPPPPVDHAIDANLRQRLNKLASDPLARWGHLSMAEASANRKLVRAGVLSQLGRVEEADNVYKSIAQDLERIHSLNGMRLWLRLGHAWAHLLLELMAKPHDAGQVCRLVRQRVDLTNPVLDDERSMLLYAESLIDSRLGHYDLALSITDERLRLSQASKNLREEAIAWNIKGIIAQSFGNLEDALTYYESSLCISRSIGYRHGEVVSLHNLGLVYYDMAELTTAARLQEQYLDISRATGNRVADAYGPAYLGAIALERGAYEDARAYIGQALQVSEASNWLRLVGLCNALLAVLEFYLWLDRREPAHLEWARRRFSEHETAWRKLDEAGEFFAMSALAHHYFGDRENALATLGRACDYVDQTWLAARKWLDLADEVIGGRPLTETIEWFHQRGFQRVLDFAARLEPGAA